MQRVKILYNKKDSALIQMAEPQQAYLGKSNMPNHPAMLPTTGKSNEKSARSLRQPKKCNQIIKKDPTRERVREQQSEHCSKESNARNDQGLNPKRSQAGAGAAAICSLFKMKNSSNMKFQTVHTFGCHSWQLLLLLLQLQMQQTKCINNKNC